MNAIFATALLLALCAAGCEQQTSPSGLPIVSMKIGDRTFQLEVAKNASAQETGLMKRDSMPKDHGMIFVFADEDIHEFWMKNTRFPLDILFLDSRGRIVSIHQMRAYDESRTSSDFPARYAIELNQGAAARCGAKAGDVLQVPAAARADGG